MLVGHGVRLGGAEKLIRQFIENLKIPAVFTWNAMDMLEYEHSCYIGRPGVVALRAQIWFRTVIYYSALGALG